MENELQHIPDNLGKNTTDICGTTLRANPRILKHVALSAYYCIDRATLDTGNPYIPSIYEYPAPTAWNRLKLKKMLRMRKTGIQYKAPFCLKSRYYVSTLMALSEASDTRTVKFISVHLKRSLTASLRNHDNPATQYGRLLAKNFQNHNIDVSFFTVIEVSSDSTLHSHLLASYELKDEQAVTDILNTHTHKAQKALHITDNFKLFQRPNTNGDHAAYQVEDRKAGHSAYKNIDYTSGLNYVECPISSAVADYMVKDFNSNKQWSYTTLAIKQAAKRMHDERLEALKAIGVYPRKSGINTADIVP